jgi:recombination protein RecA
MADKKQEAKSLKREASLIKTNVDSKNLSRDERVARMCKAINDGDYGGSSDDAVTWLGSRAVQTLERFSSGDPEIDEALGGGWAKGRFIEVYGPESGGKTTLCLHAIAEHQKKYPDEDVALIDTEYSFDEEYASALGVNTRWLIVHQPDNGQQALNVLKELLQLGVGIIVVDSVAALTTKADMVGELGDTQVAEQARLMSQSLRTLTAEAGKRKSTVFWTNQIREKIGVTYGDSTTTPAGRALKFYASMRVAVRRIETQKEKVDGEDVAIANLCKADIKKNKTAPPFRTARFYICFGRGIDPVVSTFDSALKKDVIKKSGSWFSFEGHNIGQGRYASIQFLQNDDEYFQKIAKALKASATPKSPIIAIEDNDDNSDDDDGENRVASKSVKDIMKKKNASVEVSDV